MQLIRVAYLLVLSFPLTALAGVVGLQPYYYPGQSPDKLVGIRYKTRVNQNLHIHAGKIIFNAVPLHTPGQPLDLVTLQANFFGSSFRLPETYADLGCATSHPDSPPDGGVSIPGQSSIAPSIGDWLYVNPDYYGRQGLRSSGQTIFPSWSGTIDGIDGFTSVGAASQFDLTGKDITVEIIRGRTFTTPLSGWGAHFLLVNGTEVCVDDLQPNTIYRIWHMTLTIDAMAYRFDYAALDSRAQNIRSDWTFSLRTEFFEMNGYFQAYYWDFQVLEEGGPSWRPLNDWAMPEYNPPNCNGNPNDLSCYSEDVKPLKFFYGPKFAIQGGKYVLEISNDDTDTYYHLNDIFSFPTSPTISSLAVTNWVQPAMTIVESQGTADLTVNLDRQTPVDVTVSFSLRPESGPEVHRLMTIPTGATQGTYVLSIEGDLGIVNDSARQPDRVFDVVLDSSSTAVFGSQKEMTLTVTDDDTANSPPGAPTIDFFAGLDCTSIVIAWANPPNPPTDDSGPIAAYNIYRNAGSQPNGVFVRQVDGTRIEALDRVPENGQYTYEVSAVDLFGVEGPRSAPNTNFTPACTGDTVPPQGSITSPANGAVIAGTVQVTVAYSDDQGVSSIDLYRDNEIYIDIIFVNGGQQSFQLDATKLANGAHTFYIKTYDAGGNGHTSQVINVTVDNAQHSAPTGLTAEVSGPDSVALSWDSPPPAEAGLIDYYKVVRDGNLVGTSPTTSFSDLNLTRGQEYCYIVASVGYNRLSSSWSSGACLYLPLPAMISYGERAVQTPRYRTWGTTLWSAEASALSIGSAGGRWTVLKNNPIQTEAVLATLDSASDINLQVWNGATWGNLIEVTVTSSDLERGVDLAYEQTSGRALVVYNDGTGTPKYRIWDGVSWSAQTSVPVTQATGVPRWIRLEAKPGSNEIILVYKDANSDINALVWNGTSWGNEQLMENNAPTASAQSFDVAYEQQSGHAMVTWAQSSSAIPQYRVWNGTIWSAENAFGAPGQMALTPSSNLYFLRLVADPASNQLALGTSNFDLDFYVQVWNGSTWGVGTGSPMALTPVLQYNNRRQFDLAWERTTGKLLAVYDTNATSSTGFYRTWTSAGNWSSAVALPAGAVDPAWIQLRNDPNSNQMFVGLLDSQSDITLHRWNGTSWMDSTEVETSAPTTANEAFMITYMP